MGEGLRFIQALVSIVLGVVFLALSGMFRGEAATAMILGAVAFMVIFFVTVWMAALAAYDGHIITVESFLSTLSKADEETRQAMGFMFPTVRYKMKRGIVRGMFEDTQVPIDLFRLFLQTSNEKYISPKRDWYTKEKPEWVWIEIFKWLEENEKIVPDSASGSVSWLWKGNSYQNLCAYWMAGRNPVYMGGAEKMVYASDVEATPPLKESAPGD